MDFWFFLFIVISIIYIFYIIYEDEENTQENFASYNDGVLYFPNKRDRYIYYNKNNEINNTNTRLYFNKYKYINNEDQDHAIGFKSTPFIWNNGTRIPKNYWYGMPYYDYINNWYRDSYDVYWF